MVSDEDLTNLRRRVAKRQAIVEGKREIRSIGRSRRRERLRLRLKLAALKGDRAIRAANIARKGITKGGKVALKVIERAAKRKIAAERARRKRLPKKKRRQATGNFFEQLSGGRF